MSETPKPLPQLDQLRRTQLMLRFQELSRDEQRRLRKATTRGEALPTHDERLMQYALLGEGRFVRALLAIFVPLMWLYAVGRALTVRLFHQGVLANLGDVLMLCGLTGASILLPWSWWNAHRLQRHLGLSRDSFR